MAHEHSSGLPAAYDRTPAKPTWSEVVFREDQIAQGAELNELQALERRRNRRVGNLIARDGDRISGADIVVDPETGAVGLAPGEIYIAGDVLPVAAASFTGVAMTGEVRIGVRLQRTVITEAEDPSLLGLHPGTESEGEPGAARIAKNLVWAIEGDAQAGEFAAVYLIKDGAVIDQTPPPALSGVLAVLSVYDKDANGNYIVDGCEVLPLGKSGPAQVFSIGAGTANIQGFKRIRESSIRHAETEAPDVESIAAEPHTFTGPDNGTATIAVSRPPIANVSSVIVVKRTTETVTRGPIAGGSDDLQFSSVVEIESIVYGGTTVPASAYALAGDAVSWAPGGTEPAANSTYSVTYLYNAAVTPDAATDTTVTVSGGVNNRPVLISYTSKLPRIDLLCMDITGRPAYVKGISARNGGLPPIAPSNLLKLAEVHNTWLGTPTVISNGTRNYTYDEQRRLFDRLITILDQFDRSESERDILAREPVSKKGIFTDTFVDDFYRDQGAPQTAAINQGVLQLAIDDVLTQLCGTSIMTLSYTEEIVVRQDKRTSSMKINPYDNFTVMPAGLKLAPAVDFWTEEQTQWTSPVTREFTAAPKQPPGRTTINEVTQIRRVNAVNLRQIPVTLSIEGFGAGENLATATFDGVSIKPAGTQTADAQGRITFTFTIPANIPVGRRLVRVTGAAGSFAQAIFVGEGTIDIATMRRVTLVARAAPTKKEPESSTPVSRNVAIINQITNPVVETREQGDGDPGRDPLAQTFTLPEPRHILGVNFRFTAIGDRSKGVRVQLARVANGFPTNEVLAEAFVNMQVPQVGDLVQARFDAPVFCPADREFCFVILTADATHAVAVSKLGDIDTATQTRVASQPYTVGVLLSSANRLTWTAHQDMDLHFQVVAAKFAPVTRAVDLWTGEFEDISDVLVRGAVEIPTDAARFRYELVRTSGQVIPLTPGQTWEFAEYVNEQVTLRAVFEGSETISPVLYPGTLLVGGRIRESGTYITRLFPMGSAVKVAALFAAFLPAGSTVTVECDGGNGSWQALTAAGSDVLGGGWIEPKYERASFTAAQGRVRITLAGGPGARIAIARLRAYSV
ncbi:hypothetical protein GGR34_003695 [Microvirga flocculans]|uniref:DUF4815 domain-containing protein n=1 Tax=Microvirga flocculans TaxID=217168 RepID=A0A7W6IJI7_9HYPH|nr:DUF4815 domain-containing protein [Microvirga flocculans]MBB4042010.1 hypothetical protein [Microvirga flocculans]